MQLLGNFGQRRPSDGEPMLPPVWELDRQLQDGRTILLVGSVGREGYHHLERGGGDPEPGQCKEVQ